MNRREANALDRYLTESPETLSEEDNEEIRDWKDNVLTIYDEVLEVTLRDTISGKTIEKITKSENYMELILDEYKDCIPIKVTFFDAGDYIRLNPCRWSVCYKEEREHVRR